MTLHIDITPKIRKVTAHVDLYVDGRVVGSTEVDLTPDMLTKPIAIPDWASCVEVKYEGKGGPGAIPGGAGTVLDHITYTDSNKSAGIANTYAVNVGNKTDMVAMQQDIQRRVNKSAQIPN